MMKIRNLVYEEEAFPEPTKPFVHPFYKKMFAVQYGLEETEAIKYINRNGLVSDNCSFLGPLLRSVKEKNEGNAVMYFDIRTTEEFGQTAPEYALLKKTGIQSISPVSIKGMGSLALLQGLQLAELGLDSGKCAYMLLAELWQLPDLQGEESTRRACAFALYQADGEDENSGISITAYEPSSTIDMLKETIVDFSGDMIYSETELHESNANGTEIIYGHHSLIEPLQLLQKADQEKRQMEMLVVMACQGHFGYVKYRLCQ